MKLTNKARNCSPKFRFISATIVFRWATRYLYSVLIVFASCFIGFGQERNEAATMNTGLDDSPKFRYTIVAKTSEIQRFVEKATNSYDLMILLEPSELNEANLRKLFDLLETRFCDRSRMKAWVFTSLEQVPTPEEFDRMDLYGPRKGFENKGYATLIRYPGGEKSISYKVPGASPKSISLEESSGRTNGCKKPDLTKQ